ncbi:MAG: DUF3526 domain-containing protein [Bryobacteraceae bacterium]|nr:DUF3526 domain-containing protein [Bryobacteraceae bacterium]
MDQLTMLWRVAKKEALSLVRDGRFRFASAVLGILLIVTSVAGYREYQERATRQEAFAARERARWLSQGVTSPHSAAHHGVYAFKSQSPLAVIDQGVDRWAGSVVLLEAHSQNFLRFRPAEDGAAVRRFGELSVAAILEVAVPLLIVLLAYDCFAGERESGTMRLLLSVGVRRRILLAGKALGVALPLTAVLFPAAGRGTVALLWLRPAGTTPNLERIGLIAGGYLLYFCLVLGAVLTISLAARSTRLALVVSLCFWFWNSVASSQVVTDVARWISPTPPSLDVAASVTEHIASRPTLWDRRREVNDRFKRKYGVSSILDLPVNPGGIMQLEQEEDDTRATSESVGTVYRAQTRQTSLSRWGGLVAPLLALQPVTMGLAGTDLYHHHHFASAAEQYRRNLVGMLNRASAYDPSVSRRELHPMAEATVSIAGPDLWAKAPSFSYDVPSIAEVLRYNILTLVLLAVWACALPILFSVAARRWNPE